MLRRRTWSRWERKYLKIFENIDVVEVGEEQPFGALAGRPGNQVVNFVD